MRIRIDNDLCTGHGRCYAVAPEVFAPDDRGHGAVVAPDVPDPLRSSAFDAVRNCPERAVVVEE